MFLNNKSTLYNSLKFQMPLFSFQRNFNILLSTEMLLINIIHNFNFGENHATKTEEVFNFSNLKNDSSDALIVNCALTFYF